MRYLPQTKQSRQSMMAEIGISKIDELYKDVPGGAFIDGKAKMSDHKGEIEVERILSSYAAQNHTAVDGPFFLGVGCYHHHIPASVDYIIQRSEFLTAYTPYQPEIAQGTLMAVHEFQSFVAQITGQDIANASLYDGATSMVEAALMAMRVTKRNKIVIGNHIHPDYRETLDSYMKTHEGVEIADIQGKEDKALDQDTACLIVQSPDFYGQPHKYEAYRKMCDDNGALLIVVVTEIVSLGLLPAPMEADIVCGEGQSIGLPMSFGGPHLGIFACRKKYMRQIPGRLVGETVDEDGRRSFALTLNTREQHIRREKATSNICTNQGLCALAFTVHMALLGEDGFKQLARLNHEAACKLASRLETLKDKGVELLTPYFFNEMTIKLPQPAQGIIEKLAEQNIIAGYADPANPHCLILAATELTQDQDIDIFIKELEITLDR